MIKTDKIFSVIIMGYGCLQTFYIRYLQKGVNSDESLSPYDKVKVVWN